jgi:hypothetical protein
MKKIIITLFFFLLSFSFTWAQSDVMITPQKMPSFIGGNDSIAKFITSELNKHPEFLSKISFSGKCYVNFTIDENGEMENLKLIKGISNQKAMNDIIIAAVEKIKPWEAGEHKGSAVKVPMSLTLSVKQIGSKFVVKIDSH